MPPLQAQRPVHNAGSSSASRGARGAQEERQKTTPLVPWLATDATPAGRDLFGMLKPQSSLSQQQQQVQPVAESGDVASVRRRLFGPCCREELDAWFAKHESQLDHMPPHWRSKVSSKARSQVARGLVAARHLEDPCDDGNVDQVQTLPACRTCWIPDANKLDDLAAHAHAAVSSPQPWS